MENPIKMDDLGGTTIFGNTLIEAPQLQLPIDFLPFYRGSIDHSIYFWIG